MAPRFLSPKLLRLPIITRPLHSSSSSPSSSLTAVPLPLSDKPEFTKTPLSASPPTSSSLDLDGDRLIFSSIPTPRLLRSAINLQMAAVGPMVDFGMWVMNSRLMGVPLFREIVLGAVRHTFFEHFCAGENPGEARRSVLKLWDDGLKSMLDYGLENATDNESCDRNLEGFLQTVDSARSLPQSSVSFVVVKITAICPLSLLKRVSDLLRWEYKNKSFNLPWKLNTLPIFSDSSPFYHTLQKPEPLTPQEEQDLELAHQRLTKLCQSCLEAQVPVLIDAEDTAVQPGIDYFTYSSAIIHNKHENPIIFGTIQAYLKDSKERLLRTAMAADKLGVPVGFKLVRGAYMSSERDLASSLGVESPVHDTIQDTHNCYNDCASLMLEKIASGSGSLVLATHNVESGKLATSKAHDLGIAKETERLQFAQLYGMAEALSYGLRNAGFQVSKYIPFGPVDQIIPYLLRRAEENRGLLSTSILDRELMRKEFMRRLKATIA